MPFPTPLSVLTLLDPSSPTTVCRSSLNVATLSPPLLSVRLSVTSRRSSAMLLLTSSRRCPLPLPPPPLRSLMNFPTARSSPLAMNVSAAQRLSSSHPSLEWKPVASVRICTPTLSCPEAPPCTLVLLTECRRKSPLSLHPPSRSRSLLHQRGSTLSGSEDPSWLPSPPSSRCGSPSRSTTSAAPPSSTGSASKCNHYICDCSIYTKLFVLTQCRQIHTYHIEKKK